MRNLLTHVAGFLLMLSIAPAASAEDSAGTLRAEAEAAMHRAVAFFRQHAASDGGGYVYRLSADLRQREGEEAVGPTTAWVEPPGTPVVGMAYLTAYWLTRDPVLKEAALETAHALRRGQLRSGGWDNRIEFAPMDRRRYAYRVDAMPGERNVTTLDDDKSQSATRFLIQLDRMLEFQDAAIHEAALYALDSFVRVQYANGAWPQRYSEFPDPAAHQPRAATIPQQWPREHPGTEYQKFYTLNDGTISDMIATMLLAHEVYGDPRYLDAARRAGDFLLLAQLPDPQPGWAQQYDGGMRPAWARKFEPPAISGGESQGVLFSLLELYRATGDRQYLEPIPRALRYFRRLELPDGRLARFYELGTDRPLYFTSDYQLTYSDADLPTHYAFQVNSKLDRIEREFDKLAQQDWKPAPESTAAPETPRLTLALARRAEALIQSLDARGAWVEEGRLQARGNPTHQQPIISSDTFADNLRTLAEAIAAAANGQQAQPSR